MTLAEIALPSLLPGGGGPVRKVVQMGATVNPLHPIDRFNVYV